MTEWFRVSARSAIGARVGGWVRGMTERVAGIVSLRSGICVVGDGGCARALGLSSGVVVHVCVVGNGPRIRSRLRAVFLVWFVCCFIG